MKSWILVALAVLAVIPFYWIASSAHYSACIERANAQYPPGIGGVGGEESFGSFGGDSSVAGAADFNRKARTAALKCSHAPV